MSHVATATGCPDINKPGRFPRGLSLGRRTLLGWIDQLTPCVASLLAKQGRTREQVLLLGPLDRSADAVCGQPVGEARAD